MDSIKITVSKSPVSQSVDAIIRSSAEMESALEKRRTLVDRIADLIGGSSGSLTFVFLHMCWFLAWFLINTGVILWGKAVRSLFVYPAGDDRHCGRGASQYVRSHEAEPYAVTH
jgi:uncharacterized membrane protein